MDFAYWAVFLSAALALNLSPGPDLLFILSRTFANGKAVGIASSAGVCTGALVHVSAAALGLSAILATSVTAFTIVKYIGAAYLVYLGIKNLRSPQASLRLSADSTERLSPWQAFKQGMLIDILNPKVAIFFMAFLPQFIRPEIAAVPVQLAGLGILVILIGFPIECLFVLLAAKITRALQNNSAVGPWLDRLFSSILIGLGVKLALYEKP